MATRIQFRRSLASEWTSANPVLAQGELALELDTSRFKIGDDIEAWNDLPYGGIDGEQGIQGIQGETGPSGITSSKGIATLDFGNGSLTAETVVTGYSEITADSVVMASMRITATPEHLTDDLLVDPIRLAVKDLIAGVGFTIYGEMDNARANGTYKINWIIR